MVSNPFDEPLVLVAGSSGMSGPRYCLLMHKGFDRPMLDAESAAMLAKRYYGQMRPGSAYMVRGDVNDPYAAWPEYVALAAHPGRLDAIALK